MTDLAGTGPGTAPASPAPGPEYRPVAGRRDPPFLADERTMLDAWLDFHRATLLAKCDGLTKEQPRLRSAAPSTLSLHGLLRHLCDVERGWFRRRLVGEDVPRLFHTDAHPDGAFDLVDEVDFDADRATYLAEVAAARAAAASVESLDALAVRLRNGQPVSLRWIYVHMVEEYARHNGHADLLRERIDGAVGE